MNTDGFNLGQIVFWRDPDNKSCSRLVRVVAVDSDGVNITLGLADINRPDDSTVGLKCFGHEVVKVDPDAWLQKRQLVIDVTYDLSEIDPDDWDRAMGDMETNLRNIHGRAMAECMFTTDTSVTVDAAECEVSTPFQPRPEGEVKVWVRTDNNMFDLIVTNDRWFMALDADDLAYICQDTDANETWDQFFYDNPPLHEKWEDMAQMLGSQDPNDHHEMVGFTVGAEDEDELHAWVKENRPDAWKIFQRNSKT